jgi:hypothetical protein
MEWTTNQKENTVQNELGLYEVWTVDIDGNEDLIDTTKSLKEAKKIATLNIKEEGITECIIYREDENGDLVEVDTVYAG